MPFPPCEPPWVTESRLFLLHPDHVVRRVLIHPGSLTQRIIQHCSGRFSVKVIEQQFSRLSQPQRTLLGLHHCETGNTRSVLLYCGQTPWVFAHTVIPHYALRRGLRHLTQLGNRSLGAVLHSARVMERSQVEYARFLPQHTLFQQAIDGLDHPPEQLWGRRILYRIDDNPLLVHELFLPRFEVE